MAIMSIIKPVAPDKAYTIDIDHGASCSESILAARKMQPTAAIANTKIKKVSSKFVSYFLKY